MPLIIPNLNMGDWVTARFSGGAGVTGTVTALDDGTGHVELQDTGGYKYTVATATVAHWEKAPEEQALRQREGGQGGPFTEIADAAGNAVRRYTTAA